MICNHLRRGTGALVLLAILAFPGGAAAVPAGADRTAIEPLSGLAFLWDALVAVFMRDEIPSTDGTGTDTGGGTNNSGGAMDPNGCPACKPKTDPPPSDTP